MPVPPALEDLHIVMLVSNRVLSVPVYKLYMCVYVTIGAGSEASPGACAGDRALTTCTRVG